MVLTLTIPLATALCQQQQETIELQTQASGPDIFTYTTCLHWIPTATLSATCIQFLKHLSFLFNFLGKSKLKYISLKMHQDFREK